MQRPTVRRRSLRHLFALPAAAATVLAVLSAAPAAAQPGTWNFRQADITAAQPLGHDGAGVTVAVVDTWVDRSHPDLGGRVLAGADCSGGSGRCRPGPVAPDDCGHGTHVAGTIASATYGVAPRARILPVRVLTYDPQTGSCGGSTTDVAAGIRWAVSQGAQVVNLSLASNIPLSGSASEVTSAVQDAAAAGVVVIFAAGNNSLPIADSYGGSALVVAATGPSGAIASYSQRGAGVSLAAPGGDTPGNECTEGACVASTWLHHQFALLEGTSMAAPHVSGVAALLLAQAPRRGRADVIAALTSTARPLAGAGAGLLDAAAALRLRAPAPAPQQRNPAPATPAAPVGPAAVGPQPAAPHRPAPRKSAASQRRKTPRPTRTAPVTAPVVLGNPVVGPNGTPTGPVVAAGFLIALLVALHVSVRTTPGRSPS